MVSPSWGDQRFTGPTVIQGPHCYSHEQHEHSKHCNVNRQRDGHSGYEGEEQMLHNWVNRTESLMHSVDSGEIGSMLHTLCRMFVYTFKIFDVAQDEPCIYQRQIRNSRPHNARG